MSGFGAKLKFLFFFAFFIGAGLFTASVLFDISYEKILDSKNVAAVHEAEAVTKEEAPKYFYFTKNPDQSPKVSAEAYLVGDIDTGEVILAKNADKKFPIASVSKLMTAIVASELNSADETAKASSKAIATYGGNGGLRTNEQIKVNDLLYPLLLESSNDAAEVLAEHFDRVSFIGKMNQQAEILKMSSTFYEDPSGLSPNNQSTVSDLFRLIGYLKQKKQDLLAMTTERSYSNKKHNWSNTSQFVRREGYMGGKSGFIDEALQTGVSLFALPLAEEGTRPIGIALLRSKDRKKDVESILNYLEKNIYYGGSKDASNDWVQQKLGIPDIKDPDYVTLAFAGDIMLDRGVQSSVIKNFAGDYSRLFENKDLSNILKKADIAFANLEGPASDKGTDQGSLYSFNMDPSVIPALKGAGFSVLSIANNHMADWGREAFTDTVLRLRENEIHYTGGGLSAQEAEQPVIIEKYGMKIGYLGFSDKGPAHMTAGIDMPGVLLSNTPRFEEIVRNASAQVDYLIVSFHFGEEYVFTHDERQELLSHLAIDSGAKIVIGHHPHVSQDFEVYKDGYIAYSLGNFIFDQGFRPETMQGILLEIKLRRDGSMDVKKNIVKLSKVFQPYEVILGKEEKLKLGGPVSQLPISQ